MAVVVVGTVVVGMVVVTVMITVREGWRGEWVVAECDKLRQLATGRRLGTYR